MYRNANGMSLIELLVAMALGAFLMILLTSVLSSVQTGWRRAEVSASTSNEELAGAQFIFSSLTAALPPDPLDQKTWFRGSRDRIEFLSVPPEADALRGPVKVLLYTKLQTDGRKALVVEMDALSQSVANRRPRQSNVLYLLSGLESAVFGFSDVHGGLLQEAEFWNEPGKLPRLIRIDVAFADKNLKPLRYAVAPRRNVSGRCQFDQVSLSCRY